MLPIYFAPLQGYTEDCYRRVHKTLCPGVDAYYTPFVRLEHGKVRNKDMRDVKPENNEGVPVVPQLIVRDVAELNTLLEVMRPFGYKRLDLNMGCPFTLQTRHGRGAGLLANPDEVKRIGEVVSQCDDIRFSVKMRLGLDDKEQWRNVLPLLNEMPLEHICLHPRIATQGYKGSILTNEFAEFASVCKHPLIYNGDILTVEDIVKTEQTYQNLCGIMIGRGLLARPTLVEEYKSEKTFSTQEVIARIKMLHSR
ncbi:MAG: tRNA-dihydrouridine synthase family protein, partial [Bacteroidales bacterium]|nr:tRNA-dihydrouridine synthase family protein [Bacteroidales bacterium]